MLLRGPGGGAVSYERGTPVHNQRDHALNPLDGVYGGLGSGVLSHPTRCGGTEKGSRMCWSLQDSGRVC